MQLLSARAVIPPARFLVAFILLASGVAETHAQATVPVVITVKRENGLPVEFARVQIQRAGYETTLRADQDGVARTSLRPASYRIETTMIGYRLDSREFIVASAGDSAHIVLLRVPQTLEQRSIVERWIGVRGVVADISLEKTLPGTNIRAMSGTRISTTDSAGKFEIRTDRYGATILQFEKSGYLRKQVSAHIDSGTTPDLAVLLTPGKPLNIENNYQMAMAKRLRSRMRTGFIVTHDELAATGADRLEDALFKSGKFGKNSMFLGDMICVFENGVAAPEVPLNEFRTRRVEFVEVWRRDLTETLFWPRGKICSATKNGSAKGTVRYVVVWFR